MRIGVHNVCEYRSLNEITEYLPVDWPNFCFISDDLPKFDPPKFSHGISYGHTIYGPAGIGLLRL